MTAEIAILNNGAIALAADSAVTWSGESTPKIYNTVNKLFTLSKYHPIGVMVYGNAQLVGVPWESIIKVYRQQASVQCRDRVEDYAKDFLSFLGANRMLFPEDAQRTYAGRTAQAYLRRVKSDIDGRVKTRTAAGVITDEEIAALAQDVVGEHLRGAQREALLPSVTEGDIETAIQQYKGVVDEAIAAVFEAMPLSDDAKADMHRLSANLFSRARFVVPYSGVVIAGFGDQEITPSLYEYSVCGVILNKLRYKVGRSANASAGPEIMPFAQTDMIAAFMEGVNPSFRQVVAAFLTKVLGELPQKLLDVLAPRLAALDEPGLRTLRDSLTAACGEINTALDGHVKQYALTQHVLPIMGAVGALPKEQLAEMAEALVNLTSFRQKVSGETETVGGPVDVAVISKGDGFIWIKRKHYFKPELNQHFFANYYRSNAPSEPLVPAAENLRGPAGV